MKVRLYKAEIIEVHNPMTSIEIAKIPPTHFESCNPDERLILRQDLAEYKTYPIEQWAELIRGERHNHFVVLADEILQKIFNYSQTTLLNKEKKYREIKLEAELATSRKEYLLKILSKYTTASFSQRLKYLFTRKIK